MRMDRYDDEEVKERPTRTNKNQELYTDVYLNNAYVDISELKEVMENFNTEKLNTNTQEVHILENEADKIYE